MDGALAAKITAIVARYESENAWGFAMYTKAKKEKAELMSDEFASVKGMHLVERQLFELPIELFSMIKMGISDDEYKEIWGTNPDATKNAIWFARTFPQYRTGKRL